MLALASANAVGVVLFAALYAVAGAGFLSQPAFLVCLGVLFVLVTALWTWTERRHRHLEVLARVGRAAIGLVVVVIGAPVVVLMPLFWLDTQIPPEAGLRPLMAPLMVLMLISLVLVALVNLIGVAAASALAVRDRSR
jgi:uncharacterized iron-regulated membrane protein